MKAIKNQKSRKTTKTNVLAFRKVSSLLKIQEFLPTILSCLEEKDSYTYGHSLRVAEYCTILSLAVGLSEKQTKALQISALLHDIGKIGIPDSVLLKPSQLTKSEFEIMKSHPTRGAKIMQKAKAPQNIIDSIQQHHERIDGLGYPDGLSGDNIYLYARIILIGDTFDAMTSTRPYRLSLSHQTAFNELKKYAGTQFDAKLVHAFIKGMEDRSLQKKAENLIMKKIA